MSGSCVAAKWDLGHAPDPVFLSKAMILGCDACDGDIANGNARVELRSKATDHGRGIESRESTDRTSMGFAK